MITILHSNKNIHSVVNTVNNEKIKFNSTSLTKLVFEIAVTYPDELIFWNDIKYQELINIENIPLIFHSRNIFSSYSISGKFILSDALQYVDSTFFAYPVSNLRSPTYFMSSDVGGIYSNILIKVKDYFNLDQDFDYFLCSLAKLSIPQGVFCYSDPDLVHKKKSNFDLEKPQDFIDFKFVRQHWKKRWLFFLFISLFFNERRLYLFKLFKSFFYKTRNLSGFTFSLNLDNEFTYLNFDVLIPTIGRKDYLKNFLSDLAVQKILPNNVIIIEQNPDKNSISELDYLTQENFPFKIIHIFTHTVGACNARNLGIDLVSSDWVFLADDDIRITNDFFEQLFKNQLNARNAYTICCLRPNDVKNKNKIQQWDAFGSGCSFVPLHILKKIRFDYRFEFGFGEDSDYGMQIRKSGLDVIYLPTPEIIHLKAPIGGFRIKPSLPWDKEKIPPKPSPTVFLLALKHKSAKQIYAYKIYLFMIYFFNQSIKNPVKYYYNFKKQWNISQHYALQLLNQ